MRWNGEGQSLYSSSCKLMRCLSQCVNWHFQTGGQVGRAWQDEVVREADRDQNGTRGLLPRAADMLDEIQRASPFSLVACYYALLSSPIHIARRLPCICMQPTGAKNLRRFAGVITMNSSR